MADDDRRPETWEPDPCIRTGRPILTWMREAPAERPVAAAPLYVQEKIHPAEFVDRLKDQPAQDDLFAAFNGLPEGAEYRWYEHEGNWHNRMIRGPSEAVIGSLLGREDMAGQVQMVYFDPPYGISYGRTVQADMRTRDDDAKDKGSGDVVLHKQFRDTYRRGIHSYLDGLARNLTLIRALLNEQGSVFVQIGSANVHRVAVLCDEVFGEENRIASITMKKKGDASATTLAEVSDYILWYAKNRVKMKYHRVYEHLSRDEIKKHFSSYVMIEEPDGRERKLTKEEKIDVRAIPKGCRLFKRERLQSQNEGEGEVAETFTWRNRKWPVKPKSQWRIKQRGLRRLGDLNRLTAAEGSDLLGWKRYEDEVPGRKINNVWSDNHSPTDMHYVVETVEKAIEKCLWMTTEPGDLVLDPTCGSGTTAAVAERWGRRWITIDAGAASIAWARQRLVTGTYRYWLTQDSDEGRRQEARLGGHIHIDEVRWHGRDPNGTLKPGVASGFVYERVPKVSAKILGYDEKVPPVFKVNRPKAAPARIVRLSGPFTVEHHAPYRALVSPQQREALDSLDERLVDNVVDTLAVTGLQSGGRRVEITDIHADANVERHPFAVTHGCRVAGEPAALVIAPEDATVGPAMVQQAMESAKRRDRSTRHLIIVAWAWEGAERKRKDHKGQLTVHQVQANQDLRLTELKADDADVAFVCIGEPDVEIIERGDGQVQVEIKGYDSYNPRTGQIKPSDGEDVIAWSIDTDHDGKSFFARAMHFPQGSGDKQVEDLRKKLAEQVDAETWRYVTGMTSAPFARPKTGMVAVRLTTCTGTEMSQVLRL